MKWTLWEEMFKIWMMHILREKKYKIERLMFNFLSQNTETLDIKPPKKVKDVA
jgi:hypothetical protein